MTTQYSNILAINAGSSSIKFAIYEAGTPLQQTAFGNINRVGLKDAEFIVKENYATNKVKEVINAPDFHHAILFLIKWLETQKWFNKTIIIGHRVVHGMEHKNAEIITKDLIKELKGIRNCDPDHLPAELEIIQLLRKKYPETLQVACFDTSFHATIPKVARAFAIPKIYYDKGVKRYGFHGISYSYLMGELKTQNELVANGSIILAHLGNGASLAAVKNGRCIDTSMGFTPAGGITMSTRSGDLDPGVAWYFIQKGLDAKQFNDLINHQSGLFGISGYSSDMRDLLLMEKDDEDAALAIDIFCYRARKCIGGYAAALGGLDTLVFSGGIGENASSIRGRICEDLNYLGIQLNDEKNNINERKISGDNSRVKVYVIPTDEELMIAKIAAEVYEKQLKK